MVSHRTVFSFVADLGGSSGAIRSRATRTCVLPRTPGRRFSNESGQAGARRCALWGDITIRSGRSGTDAPPPGYIPHSGKDVLRDGLHVPVRSYAKALFHWLPRHGRESRRQLLRPAGIRGQTDEFYRYRQGRRSFLTLVSPGSRADAGGARLRGHLLVGIDVRIPDAGAGNALAQRQHAEPDLSERGAPAD